MQKETKKILIEMSVLAARVCMQGFSPGTLASSYHSKHVFHGDAKLTRGVSVSMHGCLSPLFPYYPVMDLHTIQVVPCLLPSSRLDRLQHPRFPELVGIENDLSLYLRLKTHNHSCKHLGPIAGPLDGECCPILLWYRILAAQQS